MNERIEPDPADPYASYSPVNIPDHDEPDTTEIPALQASPETTVLPAVPVAHDDRTAHQLPDTTAIPVVGSPQPARHVLTRGSADRATPLTIIALGIIVSLVILALGFTVLTFGPEGDDPPKKPAAAKTTRTSSDGLDMSKAYTPSRTTTPRTSAARRSASTSRPSTSAPTTRSRTSPSTSSRTSPSTSSRTAAGLSSMPAGAQRCGGAMSGVVAASGNAQTSCAFARKVRQAAVAGPGGATMRVKSPTTGRTYTMTCTGGQVRVCTGGNGAVVYLK